MHRGEHAAAISPQFRHRGEDARLFKDVDQNCSYPDGLDALINDRDSVLRIFGTQERATVVVRNFKAYDKITDRRSNIPYSHAYVLQKGARDAFLKDISAVFDYKNFMLYDDFVKKEKENLTAPGDVDKSYEARLKPKGDTPDFGAFKRLGFNEMLFCSLVDGVIEATARGGKVAVLLPDENRLANAEDIMLGLYRALPKPLRSRLNAISCWIKNIGNDFHLYFPIGVTDRDKGDLAREGVFVIDLPTQKVSVKRDPSRLAKFLWDNLDKPEEIVNFNDFVDGLVGNNYDFELNLQKAEALYYVSENANKAEEQPTDIISALALMFAGNVGQFPKTHGLFAKCLAEAPLDLPEKLDNELFDLLAKERTVSDGFKTLSHEIVGFLCRRYLADKLSSDFLKKFVKLIEKKPWLNYANVLKTIENMPTDMVSVEQFTFLTDIRDSEEELEQKLSAAAEAKPKQILKELRPDSPNRVFIFLIEFSNYERKINSQKISKDKLELYYATLTLGLSDKGDDIAKKAAAVLEGHIKKLSAFEPKNKADRAKLFLEKLAKAAHEKKFRPLNTMLLFRLIYLKYSFFEALEKDLHDLYDHCYKVASQDGFGHKEEIKIYNEILSDPAWSDQAGQIIKCLSMLEQYNLKTAGLDKTWQASLERAYFFYDLLEKRFDLDKNVDDPAFGVIPMYYKKLEGQDKQDFFKNCMGNAKLDYWFYAAYAKIADERPEEVNSLLSFITDNSPAALKRLFKAAKVYPYVREDLYKRYRAICKDECERAGYMAANFTSKDSWEYVREKLAVEGFDTKDESDILNYGILTLAADEMSKLLRPERASYDGIKILTSLRKSVAKNVLTTIKTLPTDRYLELESCLVCIEAVDNSVKQDPFERPDPLRRMLQNNKKADVRTDRKLLKLVADIIAGRFNNHLVSKKADLKIVLASKLAIEVIFWTEMLQNSDMSEFNIDNFLRLTDHIKISSKSSRAEEELFRCVVLVSMEHPDKMTKGILIACAQRIISLMDNRTITAEYIMDGEKRRIAQGLAELGHRLDQFGRKDITNKMTRALAKKKDDLVRSMNIFASTYDSPFDKKLRTGPLFDVSGEDADAINAEPGTQTTLIFLPQGSSKLEHALKAAAGLLLVVYVIMLWLWAAPSFAGGGIDGAQIATIVLMALGSAMLIARIAISGLKMKR